METKTESPTPKSDKTCANCWHCNRGVCLELGRLAVSVMGKGITNCKHWQFYISPFKLRAQEKK